MFSASGKLSPSFKHGKYGSSVYRTWAHMIGRCTKKNNQNYKYYGGRGITVCEKWRTDFRNFLKDMGERPKGKELDRIDNNLGYSKENCRWVTHSENMKNSSQKRMISFNGKTQNLILWAKETGICGSTLYCRLKYGWSIEKALTTPTSIYINRGRRAA